MRIKIYCILALALVLTLALSIVTFGCSKPIITSISPNSELDDQVVEVTIDGAKFHKSAQVKLSKSGEKDIAASNVTLVSTKKIVCQFDLNNAALGKWDLVVTNVGPFTKKKRIGTLVEAFTVETSVEPAEEPEEEIVEEEAEEEVVEEETEDAEEIEADEADIEDSEADETEAEDPNSLLESVFFDFDKASIRNDQMAVMEQNLDVLKEHAETGYIILGGHADERGPNDYNIKLSAKRAETVKQYLIANGIDVKQIVVYAYGEESPAKEGTDEESWSFNRRVDIAIWDQIPSKDEAIKE